VGSAGEEGGGISWIMDGRVGLREFSSIVVCSIFYMIRHLDFFFVCVGRGLSTALNHLGQYLSWASHLMNLPDGFIKNTL
jgi:hypothetical protein